MAEFELGLGKGTVKLTVPDHKVVEVVEGKHVPPITDSRTAAQEALRNPIEAPPLKDVVKPGETVAIVASDITRAWLKHEQWLPVILDELNAAGIPDSSIKLIVALGAHRHHTPEENVMVYGAEVVKRIEIVQSYAADEDDFIYVGTTTRGVKASLYKEAVNADKVILTGGIVYHLMAGFGGGRKSVLPGIASYSTIQGNHAFCLNDVVGKGISPDCVSGKLEGNNMHEDATEIAAMLNPAFLFNVVLTAEGKFARFVAGHWYKAWEAGCETVCEIFGVPIKEKADLVVASAGGFPKDINLYQGSKTIDNAAMACKDDGVLILLLECKDIKEPPDFSGWFDIESLYDREVALRRGFTVPGFIAVKGGIVARQLPHIVVTLPENKEFMEKAGLIPVTTIEEALALAEKKLGRNDYTVTVMPHAANTVPLLVK
jgi:nickel-dependent lactate racemase